MSDRAGIELPVVVLRHVQPGVGRDADRRVVEQRRGGEALLVERECVEKGLERRAGLAAGARGVDVFSAAATPSKRTRSAARPGGGSAGGLGTRACRWRITSVHAGAAPLTPDTCEAARTEWFASAMRPPADAVAGAAHPAPIHTVRLAALAHRPAITYPQDGAWFAWDPDIPDASNGFVPQHSASADAALTWRLNGQGLHRPRVPTSRLERGGNLIELVDRSGRVLDRVRVELRGKPVERGGQSAQPSGRSAAASALVNAKAASR